MHKKNNKKVFADKFNILFLLHHDCIFNSFDFLLLIFVYAMVES